MTCPKDSDKDSTESDSCPPHQMVVVGSIGIKLSEDGLGTHDGMSWDGDVIHPSPHPVCISCPKALLRTLVL